MRPFGRFGAGRRADPGSASPGSGTTLEDDAPLMVEASESRPEGPEGVERGVVPEGDPHDVAVQTWQDVDAAKLGLRQTDGLAFEKAEEGGAELLAFVAGDHEKFPLPHLCLQQPNSH